MTPATGDCANAVLTRLIASALSPQRNVRQRDCCNELGAISREAMACSVSGQEPSQLPEQLPEQLLAELIARLDLADQMAAALVCHSWRSAVLQVCACCCPARRSASVRCLLLKSLASSRPAGAAAAHGAACELAGAGRRAGGLAARSRRGTAAAGAGELPHPQLGARLAGVRGGRWLRSMQQGSVHACMHHAAPRLGSRRRTRTRSCCRRSRRTARACSCGSCSWACS